MRIWMYLYVLASVFCIAAGLLSNNVAVFIAGMVAGILFADLVGDLS